VSGVFRRREGFYALGGGGLVPNDHTMYGRDKNREKYIAEKAAIWACVETPLKKKS